MPEITLLPLDDRPCCLGFPQRIGALAGAHVRVPPRGWLGHFHEGGQVERLQAWLQEQPEPWLVSLDMLVFGGLVASRRADLTLEQACERFECFQRMAEGRQVLAFQSILRAAPTQSSELEVQQAGQLVELGSVSVRARAGDAQAAARAAELERLLSPAVVEGYRRLRARNYRLNQLALSWSVRTGTPLLLGLDDSKTAGWNVLEARELHERIAAERAHAWVAPGTDESALLLLARWLGPEPVRPVWWGSPGVVGLYEDRNLAQVLAAQAAASGIELAAQASRQLFIWAPEGAQEEANGAEAASFREVPSEFLEALESALQQGSVAVADVRYANGADPWLARALLQSGLAARLTAYSAWNTAGNSLGTALAALAVAGPTDLERRRFLLERFGDDYLYQSRVRSQLRGQLGHAGLSLSPGEQEQMGTWLHRHMDAELAEIAGQLGCAQPGWRLSLPWGRLFEVELEATGSPLA